MSDEAHEADDGAQAADVVARKEEGTVDAVVFRYAKDAVVVAFAFLHTLDENTLARFEDIDGLTLEETDVGDFAASEEIAAIIELHHGVARHTDEEVCALLLELGNDVPLAVLHAHTTAAVGRETSYGIQWYEGNALVAAFGSLMRYLDMVLGGCRFDCWCCLKH